MTVLESGRECQIFIVHQPPPNSRFNERHSKADNKMEGKFQKTLDEDLWLPRAHLHKHRELGTSGPWDRGEKCRARARNLSVSMPCRINIVICSIPFCKRRRLTCGQERQPEFQRYSENYELVRRTRAKGWSLDLHSRKVFGECLEGYWECILGCWQRKGKWVQSHWKTDSCKDGGREGPWETPKALAQPTALLLAFQCFQLLPIFYQQSPDFLTTQATFAPAATLEPPCLPAQTVQGTART